MTLIFVASNIFCIKLWTARGTLDANGTMTLGYTSMNGFGHERIHIKLD